ncbi:MAG: YraN family protein [Planctomycetaceae bacterium]|nr:YraN family protein [Planctomycetaceae bacterium]|tara:strand:- start:14120 stop:14539 length:420 start_codon:yes stop_codon:yes gene_type:complete
MQWSWRRFFSSTRTLGQRGEAVAARFLRKKGYRIVARSHRSALGELDLVAVDPRDRRGPTLVFVEVKTRSGHSLGFPEEAVGQKKQLKLGRLALQYLIRYQLSETPSRFDVVAVLWPGDSGKPAVTHFEDAFDWPVDIS